MPTQLRLRIWTPLAAFTEWFNERIWFSYLDFTRINAILWFSWNQDPGTRVFFWLKTGGCYPLSYPFYTFKLVFTCIKTHHERVKNFLNADYSLLRKKLKENPAWQAFELSHAFNIKSMPWGIKSLCYQGFFFFFFLLTVFVLMRSHCIIINILYFYNCW